MKIATAFMAGVLFLGTMGTINTAKAADGIIEKEPLSLENYCHMKFPAIDPNTLASDHPVLKSADSGDVIDFYGPCDESPTGKDQVTSQRLEDDWHNPASNH